MSSIRSSFETGRSLFWRLWLRSLVVRRPQAIVAIISLLVGAAIGSMLLNLYGDVHRKTSEEFRSYGANIIISGSSSVAPVYDRQITASGGGSLASLSLMNASAFDRLDSFQPKVKGMIAAPVLYAVGRLSPQPANSRMPSSEDVVVVGADFARLHSLVPGWRITAGDSTEEAMPGACAIGAHIAKNLHLGPGDKLQLGFAPLSGAPTAAAQNSEFRVAEVVSTGSSEDDQVFIPLAELQRLSGLAGRISLIEINVPGESSEIETTLHKIAAAFPGLQVRPVRQIVYSQSRVLGTIRWLLISLVILILVIISLCVMGTMTAIVLERRKDIAVMKALGAGNREVRRLLLTEGASLGLIAGLIGFGIGGALASEVARRLFGVSLNLVWWSLPLVVVATILLAAAATSFSLGIMRGIQPATALKGE